MSLHLAHVACGVVLYVRLWHNKNGGAKVINETGKRSIPPYLPFKTLLNFLEKMEQGIPARIDRSYWGVYLSGTNGPLVVASMRFLGFLDGNNEPTEQLEHWVSNPDGRKEAMSAIIAASYGDVLAGVGNLGRATSQQLDKAFQAAFKMEGSTRRKAITFFVQAAQYAGMPVSTYITSRARQAVTPRVIVARARQNGALPSQKPASATTAATIGSGTAGNTKTIKLRSGGTLTLSVAVDWFAVEREERDFIFGLIDDLTEHEKWTEEGDAPDSED